MKMKLQLMSIGILLSLSVFANKYSPALTSQDQSWSIIASAGVGKYQHVHPHDNTTALGRLALGNEFMLSGDILLGLELGIQNGSRMRLKIPKETLAVLQWLPVQTTLGPMIDLLVTAKSDPLGNSSLFAQLKGGVAYRYWKIERMPYNDISQLAGEIQAGFGYPITTLANLNLLYQGVFGSDPNLRFYPDNHTISVSNIPVLHAVLLGLSVNL